MITLRDKTLIFFNNSAESGLQIRQGQIEMAAEVCTAFETNKPLAVEAEVGIGKSYAYLVPAIYEFIGKRQQIVIATSTIALQEQLEKDIHQILKTINFDVDVVIAKGMKNYICKHRLYGLEIRNKRDMIIQKLWDIVQISGQDIAEIGMKIPQRLLDKIVVRNFGSDHCQLCDFSYSCEYAVIRKKIAQESNIVICNQNMLVSHLVNKKKGHAIFNPDCSSYIIDEAHNLESKFRDAFSVSYSRNDIIKLMNNYSDSAAYENRQTAKKLAGSICETVQKLYSELNRQIHEQQNISDECGSIFFFERTKEISNFTVELIQKIVRFEIFIETEISEIKQFFHKLITPNTDNIIWIENDKNIRLCICKKEISRDIAKLLFRKQNVILTSATISCRQTGYPTEKYEYFLDSIHFPTNALISEPKKSPFDYDKNTMLYCSAALPHPRKKDEYRKASIAEIVKLLEITNGKTLILFTSKTDMEYVYKRLSNMHLPYKIFIQYRGSSQSYVLERFKKDINSVILGTGTYWEGINIEGESLSQVIIYKLPFPVPDPIIDYKMSAADDPIRDVAVPEMIIKLKQGTGRLIRSASDKGIVSILDSRVSSKIGAKYRSIALNSLPIKNKTEDIGVIQDFWNNLMEGTK